MPNNEIDPATVERPGSRHQELRSKVQNDPTEHAPQDAPRLEVTGVRASAIPCDDCREHVALHRAEFDVENEAVLHIAVGVMYGGWACDHVEWDDSDAALAFEALYKREMAWRDRLRTENERLRAALRRIRDHGQTHDEPCWALHGGDCADAFQEIARAVVGET